MKYKIGDKVKAIRNDGGEEHIGQIGTIVKIKPFATIGDEYIYSIDFRDDKEFEYWAAHELKLVSKTSTSIMGRLTNLARGVLDPEFKKMIRAGWLKPDLSLTDDGRDVILVRYLIENKAAFAKLAAEVLKEKKEEESADE